MPGSVWFREDFDATSATEQLRDAMAGGGTDEDAVIRILGTHNWKQRLEIAESYKAAWGKELKEDIKDELSGEFENVTVSMLMDPVELACTELHEAVSGASTDETTLIEVLCTKNNESLEVIKEKYQSLFDTSLEDDLVSDTSGYFRRLLVSVVSAGRQEEGYGPADEDQAMEDAQKFYDAGEGVWGTEEAELNAILCLRSRKQLALTIEKYEEIAGKTMAESIESDCSGDLQEGYLAIVESTMNMPRFWAKRIKKCCEGLGTEDDHLIRIIVSRSEIDMTEIEEEYLAMYEKTIIDTLNDECSGDYKKMLIALMTIDE